MSARWLGNSLFRTTLNWIKALLVPQIAQVIQTRQSLRGMLSVHLTLILGIQPSEVSTYCGEVVLVDPPTSKGSWALVSYPLDFCQTKVQICLTQQRRLSRGQLSLEFCFPFNLGFGKSTKGRKLCGAFKKAVDTSYPALSIVFNRRAG